MDEPIEHLIERSSLGTPGAKALRARTSAREVARVLEIAARLRRMTMWWGPPWPSYELRAEICADDALRVRVPVGHACSLCDILIKPDDRGISMMGVGADRKPYPVQEHIECQLRTVLGCYDLVSTGQVWTPDHVCRGQDNYREDALRVWDWIQTHPLG